jgi:hypothetical protein
MKAITGLLLALLLGVAGGGEALAQVTDLNSAINKAGRQRMLSQRMAKAYFQIGQQVDVERSRKVLDSSVALFDRQLVELKNYAPTPEIKETYLKLEKVWLAYKDLLLGITPSADNGRKVLEVSEQVLALAQQGTAQLERQSLSSGGRLVNLSGRQRMLSQRMSEYYQAIAWGVADGRSAGELDKARREFATAHQELLAAAANSPEIRDSLELVGQQWVFFDNALQQKSGADKRAQAAVATTSERILQEMEVVVAQYEKLKPSEKAELAFARR